VSEGRDVRNLFAQLGNVVKRQREGWRLALYAPKRGLVEQLGTPVKSLFATSNGGIPVRAWTSPVMEDERQRPALFLNKHNET